MELKSFIRRVPDFPEQGITFWDITTLLKDKEALAYMLGAITQHYKEKGENIDLVVAPESRGFLFGPTLATELDAGFVPIRKPGKLPSRTVSHEYELEYGKSTLEMHEDAVQDGQRVLIVDDVLATGGTARAAATLIENQGGEIAGLCFLIELLYLPGRKTMEGYDVFSLIEYSEQDLSQAEVPPPDHTIAQPTA